MDQYLGSLDVWNDPLSPSPSPQDNGLQYGSEYQPQQLNNPATTQILPRCHRCRSQITVEDRKKTKKPINGAYFKTCKRCRDNRQSARRKARTDGISQSTPPKLSTYSHDLDCSICADTLPAENFLNLSGCEHGPDVCRTCFLAWLTERMDSTVWEKIEFPSSDCKNLVTHEDVKAHAPEDVFARYVFHRPSTISLVLTLYRFDNLSIRNFLSVHLDFRYCMAEGCPSGQIHDDGVEANIFRCVACGFRVCTVHDVPFHENMTCADYETRIRREEKTKRKEAKKRRMRRRQEAASLAEVRRSAALCPGCQVPIQKNSGCDHMTCKSPLSATVHENTKGLT
jgi:hypothetical protein